MSAPRFSPSPTTDYGNGRYSQDNKEQPSSVQGALSPLSTGLHVLETQLPGNNCHASLVSVKVMSCPDGNRRTVPGHAWWSMLVASLPSAVRPAADLNQPALPWESRPSTLSQERNCAEVFCLNFMCFFGSLGSECMGT